MCILWIKLPASWLIMLFSLFQCACSLCVLPASLLPKSFVFVRTVCANNSGYVVCVYVCVCNCNSTTVCNEPCYRKTSSGFGFGFATSLCLNPSPVHAGVIACEKAQVPNVILAFFYHCTRWRNCGQFAFNCLFRAQFMALLSIIIICILKSGMPNAIQIRCKSFNWIWFSWKFYSAQPIHDWLIISKCFSLLNNDFWFTEIALHSAFNMALAPVCLIANWVDP